MSTEKELKDGHGNLNLRGPNLKEDTTLSEETLANEKATTANTNEIRVENLEKERLQKRIMDVCECLELSEAKDVADIPAITELGGLLKELAIQSDLRLDNDIQESASNFTCLMKLLEKHRYAYSNIAVCCRILNRLLEISSNTAECCSRAELLHELGQLHMTKADYESSITIAEQLAKLANKLEDKKLEAEAYYILIKIYALKGSLENAQCNLEKYLQCSAQSDDELCKGYRAQASAIVLFLEQKHEEALEKDEELLEIARRLHNRKAECEAYLHIAVIHASLFNLQKSLDFYYKGLKIAKELQYRKTATDIQVNIASLYSVMGDYHRAYKIGKRFVGKNVYENNSHTFAIIICNLSVSALILGLDEESLNLARESLAIAKNLGAVQTMASAYGNIGLAEEKMGDYSSAIESYQKCLEFGKQLGDLRIINNSYCNLGRAYEGKDDENTAKKYYEKALAMLQRPSMHWCDTKDFRFSADYLLAKMIVESTKNLSKKKNVSDKAKDYLQQVVKRCEEFRQSVQDSPLKILFNDTQKKPYQYLQYVLLQESATDEALLVGEKGRGRDFYDKVVKEGGDQSGYLDTPQALLNLAKTYNQAVLFWSQLEVVNEMCGWFIAPDGTIVEVFRLPHDQWQQAMERLYHTYHELQSTPPDKKESTEIRGIEVENNDEENPDELEETTKKSEHEIHRQKPDVSGLCSLKSKEASESSFSEENVRSTTNPASNSEQRWSRRPGHSSKPREVVLEEFSKMIDDLSELVLRPIEHRLEALIAESSEKPQLLIIPQGQTFNIPYATLRLKDGKSLCTRVSLREAYSFHSYSYCMKKLNREPQPQVDNLKEILIVGNPTNNLSFAQEEAEDIAQQLGVPPLIGSLATHSTVVHRLPHAPIIHVACHGTVDGKSLLLAPEEDRNCTCNTEKKPTHSHLKIEDISSLTLEANMVVLSACSSARGSISSEGVLGLARAFFMAGAKSVVTALWAIPDEATKAFMEKFYKNLRKEPVGDALSTTMCQMQEEESFKHVVQWGSFKVLGANVKVLPN